MNENKEQTPGNGLISGLFAILALFLLGGPLLHTMASDTQTVVRAYTIKPGDQLAADVGIRYVGPVSDDVVAFELVENEWRDAETVHVSVAPNTNVVFDTGDDDVILRVQKRTGDRVTIEQETDELIDADGTPDQDSDSVIAVKPLKEVNP